MTTTVLTLNINGYGAKHGAWQERSKLIAGVIEQCAPDIVALQAVRKDPSRRGGLDQATQLSSALSGYGTVLFTPAMTHEDGSVEGSAFLAKRPPTERAVKLLELGSTPEDKVVRLVKYGRFPTSGGEIGLFNCHFSWVDSQNEGNLEEALPFLKSYPSPSLIVGDFNATPDKRTIAELAARGWTDVWALKRENESGASFEADKPSIRIDYVFASADLRDKIEDIRLVGEQYVEGSTRLSDHLGLVVKLAL